MKYFLLSFILLLLSTFLYAQDGNKSSYKAIEGKTSGQDVFLKKPVSASPPATGESSKTLDASSNSMDFIKSFFILIVFLLILFLLVKWLQKKKLLSNEQRRQKGGVISILSSVNVRNNMSIQLVEIGSKIYVLGIGNNISLITEITDPSEVNDIKNSSISEENKGSGFKNIFLAKFKPSFFRTRSQLDKKDMSIRQVEEQRERLKALNSRI